MKTQRGFTLIELIIVIVIIGVLAVVAAPKFINVQSDARIATLEALKASWEGAASLVNTKATFQGVERKAVDTIDVNGFAMTINYGYPDAYNQNVNHVKSYLDISLGSDKEFWFDRPAVASGAPHKIRLKYTDIPITTVAGIDRGCFVEYTEPAGPDLSPSFTIEHTKC